MNIAILASGNGSNFEAIVKAAKRGYIKAFIKVLITDKSNAYVRQRAKRNKIKDILIDPSKFKSRLEFDEEVIKVLEKEKIDLVVLAGFMRILSAKFVKRFKNRILNIHPALLPAFKGENAIRRALQHNCKVTGVTVHFVDEKVDNGPIILQQAIEIKRGETLERLEERIHNLEHKLYPLAVKLFTERRIKIKNRNVEIEPL
ncbi:MAG: phosphoribosylglycinamide formyltransferase [Candidatus Omnitrophica bacterium]|jgi:phosphoribosylglycinamide formyltransferase-1|nr:phosphoribosylglycinamide formyltransferase [Candidatus Omnitrophota bacterium]